MARKAAMKVVAKKGSAAKKPAGKELPASKAPTRKVAAKGRPGRKPAPRTHRITIGNNGRQIDCGRAETILQAAVRAGIDYPYTCASGNCGACVSKLDSGKVSLLPRSDASLSPEQEEAGQTLACRARPRSDVAITWLGRGRK